MSKSRHKCKFCWHGNSSPALSRGYSMTSINTISSPKLVRSSTKLSRFISIDTLHHSTLVPNHNNNNCLVSAEVATLNHQYDVISLYHLLRCPLLEDFVIIPRSVKSRAARQQTFTRGLRKRAVAMLAEKNLHRRTDSKDSGIADIDFTTIMSERDIEHADFSGWLYESVAAAGTEASEHTWRRRWCILADMMLCVFATRGDDVPCKVILVPGSRIVRVLFSSAKRDGFDPLRSLDIKVIHATKVIEDLQKVTDDSQDDNDKFPAVTISGQPKYQLIIEDPFMKTELAFATESESLLDRWILMLKLASNLDTDLFCTGLSDVKECDSEQTSESQQTCPSRPVSPQLLGTTSAQNTTEINSHKTVQQTASSELDGHHNGTELSLNAPNCESYACHNVTLLSAEMESHHNVTGQSSNPSNHHNATKNISHSKPCHNVQNCPPSDSTPGGCIKTERSIPALMRSTSFSYIPTTNHGQHRLSRHNSFCAVRPAERQVSDFDASKSPAFSKIIRQDITVVQQETECSESVVVDTDKPVVPSGRKVSKLRRQISLGALKNLGRKKTFVRPLHSKTLANLLPENQHGDPLNLTNEQSVVSGNLGASLPTSLQDLCGTHEWMGDRIGHDLGQSGNSSIWKSNGNSKSANTSKWDCCGNNLSGSSSYWDHPKRSQSGASWENPSNGQSATCGQYDNSQLGAGSICDHHDNSQSVSSSQAELYNNITSVSAESENYQQKTFIKTQNNDKTFVKSTHFHQTFVKPAKSFEVISKYSDVPKLVTKVSEGHETFIRHSEADAKSGQDPVIVEKTLSIMDQDAPETAAPLETAETTYSCWTLDNYFRRHYLNSRPLSASLESLSSWDSRSTLTEPDNIDQSQDDLIDQSQDGIEVSAKNATFDVSPLNEPTIYDRHLPGPNNEGLLLVGDEGFGSRMVTSSTPHMLQSSPIMALRNISMNGTFQVAAPEVEITQNKAELQRVRRASLSDNNLLMLSRPLEEEAPQIGTSQRFRRSFSLTKSLGKRRKGEVRRVLPVDVAARSIDAPRTQGYLHKYTIGATSWQTFWCILKGCTLYVYSSPLDDVSVDAVDLSRCTFRECVAGYRGRQYVVEIRPQGHSAEFVAMETDADMSDWLSHLQAAAQEVAQQEVEKQEAAANRDVEIQEVPVVDDFTAPGQKILANEDLQREWVHRKKQQLLEEVLLQKQQLQQQHSINSKEFDCESPTRSLSMSSPVSPRSLNVSMDARISLHHPDTPGSSSPRQLENSSSPSPQQLERDNGVEWKELVRLKQRKMSAELKIESLNRMLTPVTSKQRKKARVKHPLELLKGRSPTTDTEGPVSGQAAEVAHWVRQLDALHQEHAVITGEIAERQQRHSWYSQLSDSMSLGGSTSQHADNGPADVQCIDGDVGVDGDFSMDQMRSERLGSVNSRVNPRSSHVDQSDAKRRLVKSDGSRFDENAAGKFKLETQLSGGSIKSRSSKGSPSLGLKQVASTNKVSRLQKLTKKFPNLPSLMPKRNMMRRVGSEDQLSTSSRRVSLDSGSKKGKNHTKRISADECLVTSLRDYQLKEVLLHNEVVMEEHGLLLPPPGPDGMVPPNSRQSPGDTPTSDGSPSQPQSVLSPVTSPSPNSDSILASVMLALDNYQDTQTDDSSRPLEEPPDPRHSDTSSDMQTDSHTDQLTDSQTEGGRSYDLCSAHGDVHNPALNICSILPPGGATDTLIEGASSVPLHDATIPPPEMFSDDNSVSSPGCLTPQSTLSNLHYDQTNHGNGAPNDGSESGKLSPLSDVNLSVLTECSVDTDSGRGSPMMADATNSKPTVSKPPSSHPSNISTHSPGASTTHSPGGSTTHSTDGSTKTSTNSSNRATIKPETMAVISAFEELIQQKLGGFPMF